MPLMKYKFHLLIKNYVFNSSIKLSLLSLFYDKFSPPVKRKIILIQNDVINKKNISKTDFKNSFSGKS